MNPLVSVVIPCYNCWNTIGKTLESVINQTYKNIEVFLVDDCSTDEKTFLYLMELKEQYFQANISVLKTDYNGGQSSARNKGMDNAKGKYIAFLDSDDVWMPNKILIQVEFMEKHPEFYFSGTKQFVLSQSSRYKINEEFDYSFCEKDLKQLLLVNCFGMSSIIVRNNKNHFRFDESIRYSADFHFLCSILSSGLKSALLNCRTLIYDDSGLNRISSKHKVDQYKSDILLLKNLKCQKKLKPVSYLFFRFIYFIKYVRNRLFR